MEIKIINKFESSDCTTYATAIISPRITVKEFINSIKNYSRDVAIWFKRKKDSQNFAEFNFSEGKPISAPLWWIKLGNKSNFLDEKDYNKLIPTKISINYGWGFTTFVIILP